jgi:N-acetylneuraminic acid mutarotase
VFFFGTSTELPGDRVLLVGGEAPRRSETSVQLGDLRAGTWQTVAPLSIPRSRHTATALPGGGVLVVGGMDAAAEEQPRSASSGSRSPRPSKVFVRMTELWQQGRWVKSGELSIGRSNHSATLLGDGRVLVAGGVYHEFGPKSSGRLDLSPPRFVAQTEVWSPRDGRWQLAAPLHRARAYHTATALPDGRVLVAGGAGVSGTLSAEDAVAELWDPPSGQWSLAGSLRTPRYDHTATLLPDGRVLVVGGRRAGGNVGGVSTSEVWDPKLRSWREVGRLNIPRYGHHAILLPGGRVFVAGGFRDESTSLRQAELWDPHTGRWTLTTTLPTDGSVAGLVPFPGGRALLIAANATLLFSP